MESSWGMNTDIITCFINYEMIETNVIKTH